MKLPENQIETIYLYDVSSASIAVSNGIINNTMEASWPYPVIIKRIKASMRMNASYGLPAIFTLIMAGDAIGDISYMTTGKGYDPVRFFIWSSTTLNIDIELNKGIYCPQYDEESAKGILLFNTGIRSQNSLPIGEQITTNIIIEGIKA